MIDAPALTNWKLGEVARSAIENAERLVLDCKAGLDDGPRAGACLGTLPTQSYAGRLRTGESSALGPLVDVGMWEQSRGAGAVHSEAPRIGWVWSGREVERPDFPAVRGNHRCVRSELG